MPVEINKILQYSVDAKASDLHLSTTSVPMVRIDGLVKPLQLPVLSKDDMINIKNEVLSINQRRLLDEKLEIDFSYEIKDYGRFRVNFFHQI